MIDVAIIFGCGLGVIIPIIIGYAVIFGCILYALEWLWNKWLWEGMDEQKRYEHTTLVFKTDRWPEGL